MEKKQSPRTYIKIYRTMQQLVPETLQILRGGLLVTMLLQAGAMMLWNAAPPPHSETVEMVRSALAMKDLTGVTFATTIIGSVLVERAARRARNRT